MKRTIINQHGVEIDFGMAAEIMDDELREFLHSCSTEETTEQKFYEDYVDAHYQKFGIDFECDSQNQGK